MVVQAVVNVEIRQCHKAHLALEQQVKETMAVLVAEIGLAVAVAVQMLLAQQQYQMWLEMVALVLHQVLQVLL
jgi:hypothetical protein